MEFHTSTLSKASGLQCLKASMFMTRNVCDRDLQIRDSLTGIAPEPLLNVGVRQGANLVTGELNVNPGTPLQMEIYLDKSSAPVYGLLVSYMKVSDTRAQEETIIFNGCSVDPYLFENFNTVDGDFLTAKFRAFKFPESTYVQFKGTVNVCLDKCEEVGGVPRCEEMGMSLDVRRCEEVGGVPRCEMGMSLDVVRPAKTLEETYKQMGGTPTDTFSHQELELILECDKRIGIDELSRFSYHVDCSNGQKGYGRRKREVNSIPADSNKVFEVTMTTFIKVDYKDDKLLQKGKLVGKLEASVILPKQNETVVAEITSDGVNNNINQNLKLAATEGVSEEIHYTVILHERNAATVNINTSLAISLVVFLLMGLALPH
uniref:ZP domain-containing protein n=1 Tax=Timema genevievae TaxID=629358 RepID=A0A7R9JYN0_TIMGE|nr:unnamed protein product [Timema genevievae]